MTKEHTQTVKKRLVFYVPGFDPMPPNRYRELYRAEAKRQGDVSGYEIEANRISSSNDFARFEASASIDGQSVHTEFCFLGWNDLVHNEMQQSILQSWFLMGRVAKTIAFSGALSRLLKLSFPPNIAGLYPFFLIPFQILSSLLLAIAIGMGIAQIPLTGTPILAWFAGSLIFWVGVKLWHHYDGKLMPYYILHDLAFSTENGGYTPDALRPRLESFKTEITKALDNGLDEILVVGHSSGVHLATIILAELLREGKIKPAHHVSFLSLGHAVPLVSYLPEASDLRLALDELSEQTIVKWVDVTAPADGACFALHNPVTSSIITGEERPMPRVISAAFRQTMSSNYYRSLRLRFFRLHFQYLCHFDKPNIYDYFKVTAGPIRLWERFGQMSDTPSMHKTNFNKFTSKAP